MGRIRTVKPEFFRSPSTARVSFAGRIFYQAMWCWADDFGVGETNLNGLLGFAFCDEDNFSALDLRGFCAEVAQHYGVTFYTVRGRNYYAIPSWESHQKLERRTSRRKHPGPDDPDASLDQRIYDGASFAPELPRTSGAESGEISAGTGEREQGNRGKGTGEQIPLAPPGGSATEKPARPESSSRGTRIPEDFQPTEAMLKWAEAERPDLNLAAQTEHFVDFWLAKPGKEGRKVKWDLTWKNWIRNARANAYGSSKPKSSRLDTTVWDNV